MVKPFMGLDPSDKDSASVETPAWWRRHPLAAVMTSFALGVCALAVVKMLDRPEPGAGAFVHFVSLPIALLLPALSVAGALFGWQGWRAGGSPLWLAGPLLAALAAHAFAIGLFMRLLAALFGP